MSRLPRPSAQRKKFRRGLDSGLPFPNFALGKTEIPTVCRCIFDGTNFYVTNHLDMHTLYYNGSFGTSSLTFRGLSYDNTSFVEKPYYKKLFHKNTSSDSSSFPPNGLFGRTNGGNPSKYFDAGIGKRIRIDVEPSTSGPEVCIHISKESVAASNSESVGARHRNNSEMSVDGDPDISVNETADAEVEDETDNPTDGSHNFNCGGSPRVHKIDAHALEEEKLILMPEEAIFLSFGVGCLAIYNLQGQALDYRQCWRNLVTVDSDFASNYAAYHYFRGKNWVPKKGENYGATYVLYEAGPDFNHSTYIVHIVESRKPRPTWLELAAWQRTATHVSKNVLLCEVTVPKEFRPEFSEPRSVFDMTLKETTLMRWIPQDSQN